MKTKFAFFDVDKTLLRGDSLISLYRFGLKKRPLCALWLPIITLAAPLMAIKLLPIEWFKAMFYSPLPALTEEDLLLFYDKELMKRRIPKSWEALLWAKSEGYHVLLCSASPEVYLRPFLMRGLCDGLIASPLKTKKNGRTSPCPAGKNCAGKEKVRRIATYCADHHLEIDFAASIAFSDSDRDAPMMALAAIPIRVTKDGKHIPYAVQ